MEKYFAMLVYNCECVRGVNYYEEPLQSIADSLASNLQGSLDDEMLCDEDDENKARNFIQKSKDKTITLADIQGYSYQLSTGFVEIVGAGKENSIFIDIAKGLYSVFCGGDLETKINNKSFKSTKPEDFFDEQQLLVYNLYLAGKNNNYPEDGLISEIETAFTN